MVIKITFTKNALKDLRSLPFYILDSLQTWIGYLEHLGIEETKKIPGYRDEALKGSRKGQRSVRLNKAYRVLYSISRTGEIEIVQIEEINKHKY